MVVPMISKGDYVKFRDGRVGYVSKVELKNFEITTVNNNVCRFETFMKFENIFDMFGKYDLKKYQKNKIEKLEYYHSSLNKIEFGWEQKVETISNTEIIDKINEIIDRLNEMSDSNED